jgi:hypothetical protein
MIYNLTFFFFFFFFTGELIMSFFDLKDKLVFREQKVLANRTLQEGHNLLK